MALAGWRNKLSAPEEAQQQSKERKLLLGYEAVAVERHREAPSAAKLVDTRKALIAHVKEIAASGNAEALPKNRKQGLPLDEARQSFTSHRARLGNYVKYRLEENEKQLVRERRKALGIAEKDYIRRQAKTLGVELAQSAKPAQAEKPQAASQSQKDLDPER